MWFGHPPAARWRAPRIQVREVLVLLHRRIQVAGTNFSDLLKLAVD